ncbi:MAG: hypothetical protein EOP84_23980 [Verrucomicrobiaceae bacterium]|nr:MAG: hypothetical protein EOP84_23980 [Verrucomicrobiaceae bacterium]
MSELLERFSFQYAKFNFQVGLCLVIVWLAVLTCAVSSILAQPFTRKQRIFWLLMVLLLPGLGLLAYLPFSFNKEQLPDFLLLKNQSERSKRSQRQARSLPAPRA